jgi:HD-like signal output (HDOD) protein
MCVVSISPERVLAIADTFPATRQILLQLGSLLQDPSVDLDAIVVPLKRDPSLTARLVRIANSAAYAQSEPVASVEDAANLIGFREVHRLVGFALLDQFSDAGLLNYGVTCQRFRENSLFTAILMEELAVGAKVDPGYCYTVGLLRSIGKVALDRLGRGLPAGEIPVIDDETRIADWENSVFGISSNEAAVHILTAWRFPAELIAAISGHFAPQPSDQPMTHLLHLAAGMADLLGHGLPGESRYWQDSENVFHKAGLEPKAANRIIDHALSTFDRLRKASF